MPKLLGEYTLTAQELHDIGCVAVESAALEMILNHFTWKLLKVSNNDGRLLTASTMLDKKLDLMHDLIKPRMKSSEKKKQLANIVSLLKEQIVNRNTIIHGIWGVSAEISNGNLSNGEAVATKIMRTSDRKISAKKIRETAEKLYYLNQELALAVGEIAYRDEPHLKFSPPPPPESHTESPKK